MPSSRTAVARTKRHSAKRIQEEEYVAAAKKIAAAQVPEVLRELRRKLRTGGHALQDFTAEAEQVHRAFCARCAKDIECGDWLTLRERDATRYRDAIHQGLLRAIHEHWETR